MQLLVDKFPSAVFLCFYGMRGKVSVYSRLLESGFPAVCRTGIRKEVRENQSGKKTKTTEKENGAAPGGVRRGVWRDPAVGQQMGSREQHP